MRILSKKLILSIFFLLGAAFLIGSFVHAADDTAALKSFVDTVGQSQEGMTLWDMIQAGGFIMIVLLLLSVLALTIVGYCFMAIDEKKVCPAPFAQDVLTKLESNEVRDIREMCAAQDNIIAQIVIAGLDKKKRGEPLPRKAMENCAKKELSVLWQNIVYLADIASVAPLIGLLGTVLGMIQAFNVIAFQTAVVKPILLAGGVSKAMVTTAGGLIVAIPTLMFYSFFRGRIQKITNKVENYIALLSH